ncbi:hypothetical protein IFU39_28870 [Paenibacillus sp. CFBP 13594]|uniref:hypothetical protein n=1 Tax=Paenibacillus sp. CFBP 13594 TaxID=2774037 RepID=UPI00178098FB|nr:hypothetical protein [Paenibacillus sp. CFBP 13594]MBD8841810.1 hypothetical protein [Paenibacillus sp. CFBP 13594]
MVILKIKPLVFILICLFALNGCSKDIENKENKFTLDDALKVLESQNLNLVSFGITGYPLKLNDVIPELYSIEASGKEDPYNPEFIHFYIFNSDKDRVNGTKEFNKHMENAHFTTFPFIYEKGNVLIVYWSNTKDNPLFTKPIETALEQLE